MIDLISLAILFIGLALASYYDLKTTEIPDMLAYFLLFSGVILFSINAFMLKDWEKIKYSLASALLIALIGFGMYFFGQWGLGDSFLLASSGFLFFSNPLGKTLMGPQLDFLFNLFLIGVFYVLFYSFFISFKNKNVFRNFVKELSAQKNQIILYVFLIGLVFSFMSFYLVGKIVLKLVLIPLAVVLFLIFSWIYLKVCEKNFIKRIHVKNLKVGDVLLESKRWDGIDKKTLMKIKKSGKKYVYVKTGVAFAPTFLIALIVTIFFGNFYFFVLSKLLFLL